MRRHLVVERARDPDRPGTGGDTARAASDVDDLQAAAVPRVEPGDDVVHRSRHPDTALSGGDRPGANGSSVVSRITPLRSVDAEDAAVDGDRRRPRASLPRRPCRASRSGSSRPTAGCRNGTRRASSTRMPPGPVERRSMNGQPATHSTPSPAATEHASSFTRASRVPVDGVVPRHGAVDDRLAVPRDVDGAAQARQVPRLARRREPLQVTAGRVEAPQRAVPEVAEPHTVCARW